MKTSRFIWRIFLVPLVTMLCAFFVAPLQAQGQSVEAYVQMSADKTTLTFFYDTKRASRQGTTWGIKEKKKDNGWQYPAWVGTYKNPNETTTKAVVDASFANFRPTSTASWFQFFKVLTAIEGLQYLNTTEVTDMSGMFAGSSALTSLDLKNFNTEKVTNMGWMFAHCAALTTLDLKSFNTSNVTEMAQMFNGCSTLTTLVLSSFNTSNVMSMDGMFAGCSALTSLDLKNFNTSNVKDMSWMFKGCSNLNSLDLKNFNTSNVMSMDSMFGNCSALTSLNLKNFNTEKVTDMGFMFDHCSGLKSLDLKNFNTSNVTHMIAMFQGCSALTSLDLKNFNTENVTEMTQMFNGCSALTSLNLKNFNTEKVTDMSAMFADCSTLTSLDLKNFNTEYVTKTKDMFRHCSALTALDLKNFNTENVTDMSAMFVDCSALTSLNLKNFNTEKVTDMSYMFSNCSALTSLDLKNFNTTNVTRMFAMFRHCSALISLDLKNFNTEKVSNMSEMFSSCSGLTSLDLKNFNTSNVTDMRWMFVRCSKLASIVCDKAWNCEQSQDMFFGCTALKGAVAYDASQKGATMANPTTGYFTKKAQDKPEVTTPEAYVQMSADNTTLTFFYDTKRASREGTTWGIEEKEEYRGNQIPVWAATYEDPDTTTTKAEFDASFKDFKPTSTAFWFVGFEVLTAIEGLQNLNTSEVTDMSGMFADCSSLTSLDLKSFNTEKVTNMSVMFASTSALMSLNLSNFNTSEVTDMYNMFADCSALTTLDLKSFNTSKVTDMSGMFYGCAALTALELKNFNTEEVTDMSGMFEDCSKLTSIVSNKTWNCEKSQDMFKGCTALKGAVAYDESKTDVKMANPETGYFTKKVEDKPEVTTPEAYVQMSADKTTLTFFYDTKRTSREGTTWGIEEKKENHGWQYPAWVNTDENGDTTTTKAVVDASFANFRPNSTASWFEHFKGLTAIEGLQYLNTSEVKDMNRMFYGCSAMTSLDLKNFNTEKVTDMNGMFHDCSALTSLDLKNFNTSNVTYMNGMFAGCSALTSLDLKSFNTEKVTDMGWMFYGCSALTNLDLKNFNTSNVTSMSNMFKRCSALPSLDLNNFNTSNVTSMDGMFDSCSALTSLDLKNFNTEKVEQMLGMFMSCSGLTTLHLTNFNTSNVTDMRFIFYGCSQLVNIVCNNTWKSKESQNMFLHCTALKGAVAYDKSKVDVTMANPETGYFTKKVEDKPEVTTPEAYVQMSADKTTLTFFYDTKRYTRQGQTWGIEEKKEDNGSEYPAWAGTYLNPNKTITKAVVDASFANFRPTKTARWLLLLGSLTDIEGLQYLNTSNVTDMSEMFAGCSRLTSLDLKSFNTEKVTNMAGMFWLCRGLTTLNLKSFNTEKVTEMGFMFYVCRSLTTLDFSNFNTSNVTNMREMFWDCSALTSLNLSSFNTQNVWNMREMFKGCSALTSLDLSKFNTEKVVSMEEMFKGCSKLASIVSNKAWNCEQSQEMFKGCTTLKGSVAYDESKVDVTMANPETGYFTKKAQDKPEVTTPEAYVQMSADKTTLTFFYDTKRATREGTTWGIEEKKEFEGVQYSAWTGTYKDLNNTTTKAVVDASFKDFRPTSTASWFQYFYALTNIEGLQNLNTSNVTDMNGMFQGCSLTSLDLKNFNTSNVTDMNGMFAGCYALTALDLSSFNTSNVRGMNGMFANCSALTSLDLKNFNTSNVRTMNIMFSGCSALTNLDLKNFNTEEVWDMSWMFKDCSALTSLNLSNFNTEKVVSMEEMFADCSKLANIFNNKVWKCEESQEMFKGCTALKGAVAYDESKTDVTMANPETGYFTKKVQDKPEVTTPEAYVQMSADKKTLTFFYDTKRATREGTTWGIEEKKEDYGRQIPAWARPDNNLDTTTTKAVFDPSFKDFRPTSTAHWFEGFNVLTAIEGLQNLNTSNVTGMNDMFYGCSALTSLDLKNFNTEKVTDMSGMFLGCSALTSLDLKNFNTLNLKDINNMFGYCSALKSIDLRGFKTEKVEDMQHMFNNCSALTSLDLSNFNTENVTNMSGMFADCSVLTSLNLKNFNTDKVEYMVIMFQNCSNLASIVCNKTWKCERSQDMFKGCTALKGAVAYDESKTDATMANPETGYFTKKIEDKPEVTTPEAYVHMSADKTTLTFFYDTKRATREGTTWGIEEKKEFEGDQYPAWTGTYKNLNTTITKAVVDASFKDFRPTNTAFWFRYFKALTAIEGLQNLNTTEVTDMSGMFAICESLTALDLSSFNTSNVTYMRGVFSGCESLTALDLSNFNPSKVTEMTGMFFGCSALTSLGLKNFNTERVKDMDNMFYRCSALTSLDLKSFNTSNVTNMDGMFSGCSALKSLDLKSFNTSNVTNMGGMFSDCYALTSLDLSSFNTSNVTDMSGMFSDCYALTSLDLSSFNTSNVKNIVSMFARCVSLKTLDLSNFNTSNVTDMSGMFASCSSLTSLDLKSFNTEKVEEMREMFYGCSALKSLDLKSFNTSNVTNMGGMFHGCSALTSLDLKNFNTEKVENMSGMFAYCSKLVNIVSDKTWKSEKSREMFKGCTALNGAVAYDKSKVDVTMANPETGYFTKKVEDKPEVTTPQAYVQMSADKKTLTFFYDTKRTTREGTTWGIEEKKKYYNKWQSPAWAGIYQQPNTTTTKAVFDDSFANFRPTSTAQWLQSLRSLINIEGLQNLNTSEVTDMDSMFANCESLTSLDLSKFNTSNVTNMGGMFADCYRLTSLDLKNFNTSNVMDMSAIFYRCSGLTSLDLSIFNTEKVTDMGWMFADCYRLTSLDLKNFNTSNVMDMIAMFYGCSGLTSLDLKNFNTEKVKDMRWMFSDCPAVTSLDLSNFNTEKARNMIEMFAGCSKLANIFSNKTWNCEGSRDMFKGCTALKGAVAYDESKVDVTMANPETGYFTKKAQDKPEVTTPEAYVQMSADKTTLTFFYDTKRASREGTTWDITSPIATRSASLLNAPAWGASEEKPNSTTTKVVFDASFAKFYPKATTEWFAHYAALKRIEGIENLNTSEVTSMKGMFTGCAALDTLDLTTFNTDKVNDMSEMFKNCANLSTVVCDKVWSTPHSEQMFYGCVKLLGKAAFDANKTSVEMANPNSGYFVAVKPTALLPVFSPAGANGIYTLQGKRVRGNLQHLPAGVYIVNGKKVVVQ